MLYWALVFLIVALVAAALGFGGIAGASAGIAKILFFIFLVLLLVSLVTHFTEDPAYPEEDFAWRENIHRALLQTLSAIAMRMMIASSQSRVTHSEHTFRSLRESKER